MAKKNRDGKPTAFQLKTIEGFGGSTKGIKTYRDAENAIKRLRTAGKANKTKKTIAAKKPEHGSEHAKKATPAGKPHTAKKAAPTATPKKADATKAKSESCTKCKTHKKVFGEDSFVFDTPFGRGVCFETGCRHSASKKAQAAGAAEGALSALRCIMSLIEIAIDDLGSEIKRAK